MQLGPESERPTKAIATPIGEPTKHVPVTDDEWRAIKQKQVDHENKQKELAATKHLRDREAAYKKEIYPQIDEARMNAMFGDETLQNALKQKKEEIDARFPEPA